MYNYNEVLLVTSDGFHNDAERRMNRLGFSIQQAYIA